MKTSNKPAICSDSLPHRGSAHKILVVHIGPSLTQHPQTTVVDFFMLKKEAFLVATVKTLYKWLVTKKKNETLKI